MSIIVKTKTKFVRPCITDEDRQRYAGMIVAIARETGKVIAGQKTLRLLKKEMKIKFENVEFVTHGLASVE